MNSLECASLMRAGQSLKVLTKVAFGDYNLKNKEKTQKILYKMSREYKVQYFRETKVWTLWE